MKKTDQYTYRVSWSEEDEEYIATSVEFPSLSWLAGSPEKALPGIRKVVADCVVEMIGAGEVAPEPLSMAQRHSISGQR
jgi:hypothetical protein